MLPLLSHLYFSELSTFVFRKLICHQNSSFIYFIRYMSKVWIREFIRLLLPFHEHIKKTSIFFINSYVWSLFLHHFSLIKKINNGTKKINYWRFVFSVKFFYFVTNSTLFCRYHKDVPNIDFTKYRFRWTNNLQHS